MLDIAHKIANIVIAVANVVIACFVGWQLIILQGQLEEMKGSSGQLNDAISAARESAFAAKALVREAALSAAAAKQSVEEAVASNKAQIRARLKVVPGAWNFSSSDISKWQMVVRYENVGKTPARAFQSYGGLQVLEFPLPPTAHLENLDPSTNPTDNQARQVILPGDDRDIDNFFAAGDGLEGFKTLSKLKGSYYRIYVLGHATYRDIYDEQHYTRFCSSYSYEAITKALAGQGLRGERCTQYDDAD
jgi:hypothetical protein